MSIVTIEQAKAQGRITQAAEDDLIQGYIDAAEQHAAIYMDRNVYPDADTLATAIAAATPALLAAEVVWQAADTVYRDIQWVAFPGYQFYDQPVALTTGISPELVNSSSLIYGAARDVWAVAMRDFRRTVRGTVVFPAFVQAVVLLVQGYYANRENMTLEAAASAQLPEGFRALLFPHRVGLGV